MESPTATACGVAEDHLLEELERDFSHVERFSGLPARCELPLSRDRGSGSDEQGRTLPVPLPHPEPREQVVDRGTLVGDAPAGIDVTEGVCRPIGGPRTVQYGGDGVDRCLPRAVIHAAGARDNEGDHVCRMNPLAAKRRAIVETAPLRDLRNRSVVKDT